MKRFVGVALVAVLVVAPAAMAFQLSQKPIVDLKEIALKWEGKLNSIGPDGRQRETPYTLVINEDGTWNAESPNGKSNGTVKVEGGVGKFKSKTTGREGKYILYETGGKRVLKLDGGTASAELTPAK
jgi:hypothetical protein